MEGSFVINPLDILIVGFIIFGMVRGSKKGLFGMSISIISVILSVLLAFRFRAGVENIYLDYTSIKMSEEGMVFLSFATAFVIAYIVVSSVLGYIKGVLDKTPLKIDAALGAVFGGLVSTLILSIALFAASYIGFPSPENARGSVTYPYIQSFARYTLGLIPKALREVNQQVQKYGGEYLAPLEEQPPAADEEGEPRPAAPAKPRSIR